MSSSRCSSFFLAVLGLAGCEPVNDHTTYTFTNGTEVQLRFLAWDYGAFDVDPEDYPNMLNVEVFLEPQATISVQPTDLTGNMEFRVAAYPYPALEGDAVTIFWCRPNIGGPSGTDGATWDKSQVECSMSWKNPTADSNWEATTLELVCGYVGNQDVCYGPEDGILPGRIDKDTTDGGYYTE